MHLGSFFQAKKLWAALRDENLTVAHAVETTPPPGTDGCED